jgi:hypothetical protein
MLSKPDVLLDQSQPVIAPKDSLMEDTDVLIANQVILETQEMLNNALFHQLVQEPTVSNSQLIESLAEDANNVLGQEKFQTLAELHVFQDHSLYALIALPDNHLMDIAANNANQEQFKCKTMLSNAIDQDAKDQEISNIQSIMSHAANAKLANGHNSFQIERELHVSQDQEPLALNAILDNQMMDIPANNANQVQSKIQTTLNNVLFQLASEHMTFNYQSTEALVEDANHANGQDKFQTTRELPVSIDHTLNAQTASLKDQPTTTHVSNANSVRFKTHLT